MFLNGMAYRSVCSAIEHGFPVAVVPALFASKEKK